MDKKDIYEHLANIYLDASLKKKKKAQAPVRFRNLFYISVVIIFALTFFIFFTPSLKNKLQSVVLNGYRSINSGIVLVLNPDIVKINFSFDPVKKEIYSIDLKKLNLIKFKTLVFFLKKQNYENNLYLRIEFTNLFKEKAEIYIKDIPHKWKECKINLSEFKNISDWAEMSNLSFVVEEWNVKQKKGIIYIDNIRFFQ